MRERLTGACRVLFVDDEPRVLDGIGRALRAESSMELFFVESAEAALRFAAKEECDVVVSDLRMYDIDGAELLGELSSRHPSILRVLLSGQMDSVGRLRAGRNAHRVLTKPVAPAVLAGTIRDLIELRDRFLDPIWRPVIQAVQTLPPSPALCAAAADGTIGAAMSERDLERLIGHDPNAVANILKFASSAFSPMTADSVTLAAGIRGVGVDLVRVMLLTDDHPDKWSDVERAALAAHRRQSFLTASIARRLASSAKAGDEAFIAGLLHDVGTAVLLTRRSGPRDETAIDGSPVDRAQAGAYLLGLWGISNRIVDAVANHAAPVRGLLARQELMTIVHVAHVLAFECEPGEHTGVLPTLDGAYLSAVGATGNIAAWRAAAADVVDTIARASS